MTQRFAIVNSNALERLLPRQANNDYRGSKLALYTFAFLSFVMLGRSLIHLLKDDAGANSIATIIPFAASAGAPDPDAVIYMFASFWGLQQTIMALLYFVVLYRYRNLIPLMYVTLAFEWGGRLLIGRFLHRLGDEYFLGTAPGKAGAIPMLVLISLMFLLSLKMSPIEDVAH